MVSYLSFPPVADIKQFPRLKVATTTLSLLFLRKLVLACLSPEQRYVGMQRAQNPGMVTEYTVKRETELARKVAIGNTYQRARRKRWLEKKMVYFEFPCDTP